MNIASFLSRKKLSQTQLAEKLSVSQATISYWSMGKTAPSLDVLKKLILMGMTIGEIFDAETEAFVLKGNQQSRRKLCADVVETALSSLVGGKGKITDVDSCRQIVKTGLDELFGYKR